MNEVSQRISRLERDNRIFKALLFSASIFALMAAKDRAVEKVVRAESFAIVDSDGNTRGFFGCNESNEGSTLLLSGAKTQSQIFLGVNSDKTEAKIALTSSKSDKAVAIELATKDTQGEIRVRDISSPRKAFLGCTNDGSLMGLSDGKGRPVANATGTESGVHCFIADAKRQRIIAKSEKNNAAIGIVDEIGRVEWSAPD